MLAFYCDQFVLPLPPGHRFPMRKYEMLRDRVAERFSDIILRQPEAATEGELALVHSPDYIARVREGTLSATQQRAIGFPWSAAMAQRARRSVGATIQACRAALESGAAVNLAGGTHHARQAGGEGFCVFNDVVVAASVMQVEQMRLGRRLQVLVIDLDVHQGDGTAALVRNDPSIFSFSMHGRNNYPFEKQVSDLDVELDDLTTDEKYMVKLEEALREIDQRFEANLIIYLAGLDAHEGDRLGKLSLSAAGLQQRDEKVFSWAQARRIPVAMCMAGGYGTDLTAMVELQADSIGRLLQFQQNYDSSGSVLREVVSNIGDMGV